MDDRRQKVASLLKRKGFSTGAELSCAPTTIPTQYHLFDHDPSIQALVAQRRALEKHGIENPYFRRNDGVAAGVTSIAGNELINFASYNYIGLSGEERVSQAAMDAIRLAGTSVSASRIASGEREIQGTLEQALAAAYDVPASIVFVSGHATNVTVIGHLFGSKDLILHDELAHNSAIQGALLSGAQRIAFPHNDHNALERLLGEHRASYERVLIFVEGIYSMDGDLPDLPAFVNLRNRYRTYLMVDEAHSFGVLGARGLGIREHFGLQGSDVDIWMGTLSKSLASCGGYIAARTELVDYLKYTAPGFLYSVGITPANAAAAHKALEVMQAEPERVTTLRARSDLFRHLARERNLQIGRSSGSAIVPVIVGESMAAIQLSNALFSQGVNVQPILYPAVEQDQARLRFFISSMHTEEQIETTVDKVAARLSPSDSKAS